MTTEFPTIINTSLNSDIPSGCGCSSCMSGKSSGSSYIDPNAYQDIIDNAPTAEATPTQYANWLTNGYWLETRGPTTATTSSGSTVPATAVYDGWGDKTNFTYSINSYYGGNSAGIDLAFSLWADVAGITFTKQASGGDIPFINAGGGSARAATSFDYDFSHLDDDGTAVFDATIGSTDVSIDTSVYGWTNLNHIGGYGLLTTIHEIGHALGLGHGGDYNGSVNYNDPNQVFWTNDTGQYSTMSYIDPELGGANHGNGYLTQPTEYASTPMLFDILAIQNLYGANMSTRTGNTTYGFNVSSDLAGRDMFDFSTTSQPVVAIWDAGGIDTIDLSGYSMANTIRLGWGQFSDVGGFTKNLSIAYNVTIENAYGGSNNDTIYGNNAANELRGNNGNDHFHGSGGNDTINGGNGADTVQYYTAFEDFIITAVNAFTVTLQSISQSFTDTVQYVENFIFNGESYTFAEVSTTSTITGTDSTESLTADNNNNIIRAMDGNDTVFGRGGNDIIYGGDGNDILRGEGGTDTVYGEAGNDIMIDLIDSTIDGGEGTDDAYFWHENEGLTINLANGTLIGDISGDTGTITNVENIRTTTTGAFEDTVTGNDQANIIYTYNGNDTIYGGEGDDRLWAGGGDDTLHGGAGDEIMRGEGGNDSYYAGAGDDLIIDTISAVFDGGEGVDDLRLWNENEGITINLVNGTIVGNTSGDSGTITSIEEITTSTGTYDDDITGDDANNVFFSRNGNDTVRGGGGDDSLWGGGGNDTLYGDAGDDIIRGEAGNDSIYGGAGNDLFIDTIGDVIDGGDGRDDLRLWNEDEGLTIDLVNETITGKTSGDSGSIISVEEITTSTGNHGDTITGDSANNSFFTRGGDDVVRGGGGDDILWGDTGNDTLYGEADNDIIRGEAGADNIYGGAGNDWLIGGGDADTFFFEGATAFNGVDTIADFSAGQGDIIDISDVLIDFDPLDGDVITDFIEITTSGSNSQIRVDADGGGDFGDGSLIAFVNGVTGLTDEAQLVSDGTLVVA